MSSPLKFALGILGAASIGSVAFGSQVNTLSKLFLNTPVGSIEKASVATPAVSLSPSAPASSANTVTLNVDRGGHFAAQVSINGVTIDAMVDTGASMVAISYEDAQRIGLSASGQRRVASTANGSVSYTPVRLSGVRLNGISVYDVEGAVMPPGALKQTLLGMSFLRRLGKFEMHSDRLVLAQ